VLGTLSERLVAVKPDAVQVDSPAPPVAAEAIFTARCSTLTPLRWSPVWDLEHDRPHSFDGREPPAGLGPILREAAAGPRVVAVCVAPPGAEELSGLAVALPTTHSVLALLDDELPMRSTREPFETMLADLVTLISARAAPGAAGIAGPAAAAG
jgi:hypothetical protein